MRQVKTGDKVSIHYTGSLDDGTVFDTSRNGDPVTVEVGSGQLIKGVDEAMVGMVAGESKRINVFPEKGYGLHLESAMVKVKPSVFPADILPSLTPGVVVDMIHEGEGYQMAVVSVSEDGILLDANHPLAGLELVFDIEIVEIGK